MKGFTILEDLPLEERRKYLDSLKKPCHIMMNENDHYYKIEYSNRFTMNENLVTYIQVEDIIKVRLLDYNASNLQFDVFVVKNEIKNGLDFFPNVYRGIIDQMTKIKDHIVCSVDSYGTVVKVFNAEDISRKWQNLKKNLINNPEISKIIKEDDLRKLLEAGDKEYSPDGIVITSEMNQSIAFSAFFTGFMDMRNSIVKRTYLSSIFPKSKIDVKLQISEEYTENETVTYSLTQKDVDIDENNYKKMFLKNYYFLNEKFEKFQLEYLCLNTIDVNSKWLISNRFTISEKINNSLNNLIICEIDKISNYG